MLYFLRDSHEGYCQYFAMAMGEMLRSLGIPTRLVNGYGAGFYDDIQHRQVVRDADAHVWVESYFPGYGWIPFEPTNDSLSVYSASVVVIKARPGMVMIHQLVVR